MDVCMKRKAIFLSVFFAFVTVAPALGNTGYEGQPGNQSNGGNDGEGGPGGPFRASRRLALASPKSDARRQPR